MKTLSDLFAEHEADAAARTRAEIAAEDAARAALSPADLARLVRAREEKLDAFADACEAQEADDDDDDDRDDERAWGAPNDTDTDEDCE